MYFFLGKLPAYIFHLFFFWGCSFIFISWFVRVLYILGRLDLHHSDSKYIFLVCFGFSTLFIVRYREDLNVFLVKIYWSQYYGFRIYPMFTKGFLTPRIWKYCPLFFLLTLNLSRICFWRHKLRLVIFPNQRFHHIILSWSLSHLLYRSLNSLTEVKFFNHCPISLALYFTISFSQSTLLSKEPQKTAVSQICHQLSGFYALAVVIFFTNIY